jgi:PPIC-type PPIASE domain
VGWVIDTRLGYNRRLRLLVLDMRHRLDRAIPIRGLVLVAVILPAAGAACRTTPREAARSSDDVVAAVDGARIGRAELVSEMRRTLRGARAALDRLIDDQLLAAEAQRSLDREDNRELAEARARAAVQLMLERELEPRLDKSAIPDATLRSLYDSAHSVFVHPRLVEVALLSVYTGARMKEEPRARALQTAKALEAYVRSRPVATPADWKAIADQPSWRDQRVKYARLLQALDEPLPADVGRAVAALSRPGQTTPLVVAETGYHLAQYIAERPPENIPFEAAKPQLRDEIHEPWRRTQFLQLVQVVANPHHIEAFPERLTPDRAP